MGRPLDGEGMRRRVGSALHEAERGEEFGERELRIVRWVTSPGDCRACYGRGRVAVLARRPS